MGVYSKNGIQLDQTFNYDTSIKSINHRGFSNLAPENTLPAYVQSKRHGYTYVETDVSFTSDNIPVLLHDATIDRTSNGTGTLSKMTYDQVKTYDFGSWKDAKYTGVQIPTLNDFLTICKLLGLKPYIELKDNGAYTNAQIKQIVDMVQRHGMKENSTYISFNADYLQAIKELDSKARLGFLKGAQANYTQDLVICNNLKTSTNKVFYDVRYDKVTQQMIEALSAQDMPIEVWTIDDKETVWDLDDYITGVTTNSLNVGKIFVEHVLLQ